MSRLLTAWVVAFWCLVLISASAYAQGSTTQTAGNSTFAGDPRLAVKKSVHSLTVPVRDLLATLSRQSGVDFFADDSVADEPVTVIAHDVPLSETLLSVSRLLGYVWNRTGSGSSASYTLRMSEQTRKQEAESRERRLAAAARHVQDENEEYFKLSEVTEARRQELAAELPAKLATETDVARAEELRNDYSALMELSDSSPRRNWSPAVRRLLRSLPPDQVSSVLKGGMLYYSWPHLPGCREFPQANLQELQQIGRMEFSLSNGFRGEIAAFRLRILGVGGRQPYLTWHLSVGQKTSQFQTTTGFSGSMPSSWALSASSTRPPTEKSTEDWRQDKELSAHTSVKLVPRDLSNRRDSRSPLHPLGDVLDALDKAHPVNVVADAFWTGSLPGFEAADVPVGEILDRLCRMLGRTWRKEDAFVLIQSRDISAEREAEPPATVVRRWTEAVEKGLFTLEDMADIATLPDSQLITLSEMAMRGDFPVLYSPLHNGRSHLRLWSSLSSSQRQKAKGEGLSYKELGDSTRLEFILAATDPSARQLSSVPADEDQITKGRLRVAQRETQEWRIRGKRGATTWNVPKVDAENQPVSREEALKRFRSLDDSIEIEDVQLMVRIGVTFSYDSDKGPIAMSWVELPPRWIATTGIKKSGAL